MKGHNVSFAWQPVLAAFLFLLAAGSSFGEVEIDTVKRDGTPNRAAWMPQGTYGMMVHYLIKPQGDTPAERTADLNRTIDNFDLDHFLRQFDETGAD